MIFSFLPGRFYGRVDTAYRFTGIKREIVSICAKSVVFKGFPGQTAGILSFRGIVDIKKGFKDPMIR